MSCERRWAISIALLFLTGLASRASAQSSPEPAATEWSVAAASRVTYHAVHRLHRVTGISPAIVGKARISPGGDAQVMIRVTTASFDSGNVNRDAHIKESLEAARFPTIELKAIGNRIQLPDHFPNSVTASFTMQLQFHGQTETLVAPVDLVWESPRRLRAACKLDVSLARHGIKAPRLMFIAVEDLIQIEADLIFER
jgi:polyisoprenoid-binding protein YceI